ncbi:MAG TPA: riboflavin kinase [Candidatus Paceibacterota bacterium]
MEYIFSGKVIRGEGNGRKIGYPTINIDRKDFLSLKKKPVFGVYCGKVTLSGKVYNAGIVIGPLDKKGLLKVEAHLLGYKGNAYGKQAIFEIEKFLRKFKKFKNEKELIAQIEKDLEKC